MQRQRSEVRGQRSEARERSKGRVERTSALAVGVVAIICFVATVAVRAQEPRALVAGLKMERSLSAGEKHAYTIHRDEGAAVIGAADQHGIDLVIDLFDPDGKLIRTDDSPNGTEGPEPIDLTAFRAGVYRLVIHDYVWWRGSLADGLLALIGRKG